jgi:opacity protein-like surface antigen
MSRLALLGVAALLSAAAVAPAAAQEVISNPGYCAQFYPNANCQNKGANNPYTGDYQMRNEIRGAYASGVSPCALGADYFIGRGGRRYACN